MRERFVATVGDLLEQDERTVVVLAVISAGLFRDAGLTDRFPDRIVDVGIREQTQIGVAGGLALEGLTPIVTGYAPFLVERAYEQIKVSLAHQGVTAILASVGASWDSSGEGRTHQAPEDVALMATIPGVDIHVPGHALELEAALRHVHAGSRSAYLRMTTDTNAKPYQHEVGRLSTLKRGSESAPTIVAVGPVADATLAAVADIDATVVYTATPSPIDARGLRAEVLGSEVLVVEPYLAGTTASRILEVLSDRPIRLRSHGVSNLDVRMYGLPDEHRRFHGLDAGGIRSFVLDAVRTPVG
jgi:transketolase